MLCRSFPRHFKLFLGLLQLLLQTTNRLLGFEQFPLPALHLFQFLHRLEPVGVLLLLALRHLTGLDLKLELLALLHLGTGLFLSLDLLHFDSVRLAATLVQLVVAHTQSQNVDAQVRSEKDE